MDININFETIFQAIRWCIFLLLGCRKFGAPLWRSSCNISHRGTLWGLRAYLSAIRTKYDEFVTRSCLLVKLWLISYFVFFRGTKNAHFLTCGVTALLVVPGAHYLERSTAVFFCYGVFTDKAIFSLNLPWVKTPPREKIDRSKLAPN